MAIGRDEDLRGRLELVELENLGRKIEPRHRRIRGVVSHRQQKRGRLIESGTHQLDLADELVHSACHLLAPVCQAVGALPDLRQARLQASRSSSPMERTAELNCESASLSCFTVALRRLVGLRTPVVARPEY